MISTGGVDREGPAAHGARRPRGHRTCPSPRWATTTSSFASGRWASAAATSTGWTVPSGRRVPPLVMGHEAAGVVEAVGRSVTGWAVGDQVTFDSTVFCGRCAWCTAGVTNLCDDRRILGVAQGEWRRDGAFAERVAVPARIVHRLPPRMSMVEAALTEPLTVALHAVSRAPVAAGDWSRDRGRAHRAPRHRRPA